MVRDLLFTALVEFVLYLWLGSLTLLQSLLRQRRVRRELPLLGAAQESLSLLLSGSTVANESSPMESLRPEKQADLLLSLAVGLGGTSLDQIREEARRLGHLGVAQKNLLDRRWWLRLRGARLLSALGEAPANLERLLRDGHPLVRAEAIHMVGPESPATTIEFVVRELFAPPSLARFASQSAVPRLGTLATEWLVRLLPDPPGPASTALRAAASVADPRLLPVALQWSRDGDSEVRASATTLLGALGGQEAAARLVELLHDEVRAEAAQALGHLGHWQAGPTLSRLLSDSDWEVRHQSALALRRLGPPGELYLRQAAQASEPEVAAMARYALGRPGLG